MIRTLSEIETILERHCDFDSVHRFFQLIYHWLGVDGNILATLGAATNGTENRIEVTTEYVIVVDSETLCLYCKNKLMMSHYHRPMRSTIHYESTHSFICISEPTWLK